MRLYKATPITFLSSRKSHHVVWYRINVLELPIASNFRAKYRFSQLMATCDVHRLLDTIQFPTLQLSIQCTLRCNLQTQPILLCGVCVLSYTARAPTYMSQCAVICFSPTTFQCKHILFKTPACQKFKTK